MTASTSILSAFQSSPVASNSSIPRSAAMALAIALASTSPAAKVQAAQGLSVRIDIHDSGNHSTGLVTKAVLQNRMAKLRAAVARFKLLGPNWDGEDAAAPNSEHVDLLLTSLSSLPLDLPAFRPMLGSDGEIGVYCERGDSYAELSIDPEGEMSLYLRDLNLDSGRIFVVNAPYFLDAALVGELRSQLV